MQVAHNIGNFSVKFGFSELYFVKSEASTGYTDFQDDGTFMCYLLYIYSVNYGTERQTDRQTDVLQ